MKDIKIKDRKFASAEMGADDADSPRVIILADDLSSATDCGVQMAISGPKVMVPLGDVAATFLAADVLSFDIDSRHLSGGEAYVTMRAAMNSLSRFPNAVFYKSIDSTLRGNLGAEIAACLDTGLFEAAIVAPAFPTYGRTTVGGVQFLRGVPVSETEFGSDPSAPVTTSNISDRISEQCRYKSEVVSLEILKEGEEAICQTIIKKIAKRISLFIIDTVEENDLQRIATAVARLPKSILWVGSTGLSRYVPEALDLHRRKKDMKVLVPDGITLIVAGSASQTTREQLDACARRPGFIEVQLDTAAIAQGGGMEDIEISRAKLALSRAIENAPGTIALTLRSSRADIARAKDLAADNGEAGEKISEKLVDALGGLTTWLLNQSVEIKGLILTGGATAKTVASACGTEAITIIEEIEPGIPLALMLANSPRLIVVKAGGFGDDGTLIRCIEKICSYGED